MQRVPHVSFDACELFGLFLKTEVFKKGTTCELRRPPSPSLTTIIFLHVVSHIISCLILRLKKPRSEHQPGNSQRAVHHISRRRLFRASTCFPAKIQATALLRDAPPPKAHCHHSAHVHPVIGRAAPTAQLVTHPGARALKHSCVNQGHQAPVRQTWPSSTRT